MTQQTDEAERVIAEAAEVECPRDLHFRKECEGFYCGAQKSFKEGFDRGWREGVRRDPKVLALVEALKEAEHHFNAIMSGLTTDINQVESLTKHRAYQAKVEVILARERWEASNGK